MGVCSASWSWVLMCFSPLSDSLWPAAPGPIKGSPWSLELDGAVNIWWAAVCFQQLSRRPRSEKSADSRPNTHASATNGAERAQPCCPSAQALTQRQSKTRLRANRYKHTRVFKSECSSLLLYIFWICLPLLFFIPRRPGWFIRAQMCFISKDDAEMFTLTSGADIFLKSVKGISHTHSLRRVGISTVSKTPDLWSMRVYSEGIYNWKLQTVPKIIHKQEHTKRSSTGVSPSAPIYTCCSIHLPRAFWEVSRLSGLTQLTQICLFVHDFFFGGDTERCGH